MKEQFFLSKVYQFLLVFLAFLLPLTVFGANLIIVLIVLIWLFSGNYKLKYRKIISSKFLIASGLFYLLHVVGLIWTSDLKWGFEMLHKMWYFILLLPVLYTIVQKKYIKYYITSFLVAISFSELVSYLIWFEIIPPFKMASVSNPVPFMSHVSYNPILAFAIYLVAHEMFLNKDLDKFKFFMYSFFATTMTINMFITGGRSGHVMFFAMIAILIFQFFKAEKIKSLITISILIPGIFFIAYQSSTLFENRVNAAINDVVTYEINSNTSVGKRIDYMVNSFDIIKKNPFIGVGTGDFPNEFLKVSIMNANRDFIRTDNPHNMYNLVVIQFGLLGLLSFLSIFYYQIKQSFQSPSRFMRDVGITLPLLFLLIMFGESYLLGHYTTLLYVFFSSFIYNDFKEY
ncbi:O-antigen ligase family protein [Candidatus Pseudothioglobus sp. Uisw_050_01]|uniref:O-antigen ligase family protein n=1 Tax=Candidatus Pseudothioglobus sp. Uisw_050_01 TaxID=3230997 RepID=UPI003A8AD623